MVKVSLSSAISLQQRMSINYCVKRIRENFGDGFISMMTAMKDLSEKYPDVDFVYPMHINPNVRKPINEVFGEDLTVYKNFFFIEPLQYLEFVCLVEKSTVVLTESCSQNSLRRSRRQKRICILLWKESWWNLRSQ